MVGVSPLDGVVGGPGSVSRRPVSLSTPESYERFLVRNPSFAPQYAHLYFCRLMKLRPVAAAAALAVWGPPNDALIYADGIQTATATADADTVVVGILFRDFSTKPSILLEYGRTSSALIPAPPARSLTSYVTDGPANRVILEDETGRVVLDVSGVRDLFTPLATGFILAVRGRENRLTGKFIVNSVTSPLPAPQPPLTDLSDDVYVCVVSGLGLGAPDLKGMLASELLLEYLRANLGDETEEGRSAQIAHLIVAGNSVAPPAKLGSDLSTASALLKPHLPVDATVRKSVSAPIKQLDRFLTSASAAIPISLMPGEHDPTNYLLPQQPFHPCLLPSSSRESNLHLVPNPYEREIESRLFIGTSGQNVHDFVLYNPDSLSKSDLDDAQEGGLHSVQVDFDKSGRNACCESSDEGPDEGNGSASIALQALEVMLNNRHLAPTAPDTLPSYPFYETDPFIVERTPHVFFAGNQPKYGTRLWRTRLGPSPPSEVDLPSKGSVDEQANVSTISEIRLVSVPRFDESGLAVLINLRSLDCTPLHFGDRILNT